MTRPGLIDTIHYRAAAQWERFVADR